MLDGGVPIARVEEGQGNPVHLPNREPFGDTCGRRLVDRYDKWTSNGKFHRKEFSLEEELRKYERGLGAGRELIWDRGK